MKIEPLDFGLLKLLPDIGSYSIIAKMSITSRMPKHLPLLGTLIDDSWRALNFSYYFGQITGKVEDLKIFGFSRKALKFWLFFRFCPEPVTFFTGSSKSLKKAPTPNSRLRLRIPSLLMYLCILIISVESRTFIRTNHQSPPSFDAFMHSHNFCRNKL